MSSIMLVLNGVAVPCDGFDLWAQMRELLPTPTAKRYEMTGVRLLTVERDGVTHYYRQRSYQKDVWPMQGVARYTIEADEITAAEFAALEQTIPYEVIEA